MTLGTCPDCGRPLQLDEFTRCRECFDELTERVDAAVALCRKHLHPGVNLASHRLAMQVLEILEPIVQGGE
jgi:predicted amidophosphoribosyltransferase